MTELIENEEGALREIMFDLESPHSLAQIADHLGCSREYVRRIEARALDKLERAARRRGITMLADIRDDDRRHIKLPMREG